MGAPAVPGCIVCTADGRPVTADGRDAVHAALQAGDIVAVKGVGGFHLACDASNRAAVTRLRALKGRSRKPFALMARNLGTVAAGCELTAPERATLLSPAAPIVLLRPHAALLQALPLDAIAPGLSRLGVMLPYTPIHASLFSKATPWLIMTSGNRSGLPIARTDAEAFAQLCEMASLFVLHERDIPVRTEDSLVHLIGPSVAPLRRSRGYVWAGISVPVPPEAGGGPAPVVLAAGPDQKNTCCLLERGQAVLSPHHGDIDGEERLLCWEASVAELTRLGGTEPTVVAYDPHPGYVVSAAAKRLAGNRPSVPVFHHHAHLAACMAEHGLTGSVIGCILDGTGYGPDGTLWGFEILVGDYVKFDRIAHAQPLTLPGGEAAIRHPWLLAVSLIYGALGDTEQTAAWARQLFPTEAERLPLVLAQLDGRLPSPQASSAGRLFDAVAAMLGLCTTAAYDGEAALLLGDVAERDACEANGTDWAADAEEAYPVAERDGVLLTGPLVRGLLADVQAGVAARVISRKFHHTVAQMVGCGARLAADRTGLRDVVLSGGVWNNRYLLAIAKRRLQDEGFTVYTHRLVPPGDGGLALGQAVCALWRWQANVSGRAGASASSRSGSV